MTDNTESTEFGGPAPAKTGGPAGPAVGARTGSGIGRAWRRYRAWRRSRPFWAGIWLIIAGAELLLIPLPVQHMGVILHIGIGGISGILIGAILIALGLLLWFHPAQRLFYSIVAVLLAVAALVASNLGGFLLGTVLGIIGASLGFAWMPGRPERRRGRRRRSSTEPDEPDGTALDLVPPTTEDVGGANADAADADAVVEETADGASDAAPASASAVTAGKSDRGRLDPSWGAADLGGAAASSRPNARYAQAGQRHARRHGPSAPHYRISPRGTVIGGNIL